MNNLEDNLEDNISSKKLFIYNKINDLSINSNILIDYVIFNKLKYTKNKNGIFLNLYSVENIHIENMYNIIINKINFINLINSDHFNLDNKMSIEDFQIKNNTEEYIYKDINKLVFDKYDTDIILFTKN